MHWRRNNSGVVIFAMTALLLSTGCATTSKRFADWPTIDSGRVLKNSMATVDTLSRQRRSLRGQIKIAAPFLPGKTAVDAVLIAQPMDILRLDMMDPVGGMVAGLNLQLDALDLWLPGQMRVYETDSSDESIARLTRLPWTFSELFAILQGLPPKRFSEEYTDWSIDPDGIAVNGDGDAIMALSPGLNLPETFVRFKNMKRKSVVYEIAFDDYRPTKLGMFPHHITVNFVRRHKTVELWFDNVEWNPTVAWGALAFDFPEGTKIVRVR